VKHSWLSIRTGSNANHHLWNNHGKWWCHFTLHFSDYTKERVRLSLDTAELTLARFRRDRILNAYAGEIDPLSGQQHSPTSERGGMDLCKASRSDDALRT
jgi:hypothetical protein